jgi:hypothetical protein
MLSMIKTAKHGLDVSRDQKSDGILYRCKCKCGGDKITSGSMLRRGKVKSCGCMNRDRSAMTDKHANR